LADLTHAYRTYAILHNYLALRHIKKQGKAEKLLQDYARDFKGKDWESYLLQYHQGGMTESELIEKARHKGYRCEAFYYIGHQYLLKADKEKARDYFQKSIDTEAFCL
jgi:lipoprotein NlpI